jgi:hypothetical protein
MELTNLTRYPAGLARMACKEDRIAASAIVRVTYEIRGGALVVSEDQPWEVSMRPWEGPKGWMDGDYIFYKEGVDVFLFGRAIPPGGEPASQMDVELRIGEGHTRRVRVFGPRVWERGASGLVASSPQPFPELPLTLANAFGGKDAWDGLTIAWQENPYGIGFFVSEESAEGKRLPCIEEIDHLISAWDDKPPVAGLGPLPLGSPLHSKQGLEVSAEGAMKITPRLFNAAFAPMIAKGIKPGDAVQITGVSASGPVRFRLPEIPFVLRLRFGAGAYELPFSMDQIGIEVDEERVFIAYRSPFRYVIRELEERQCELMERGAHHATRNGIDLSSSSK